MPALVRCPLWSLQDAEVEQAQKGDASDLHVIIFDEIDAICKQRGSVSSGSGVHDTVVNQLLTKIDGVDALNNILLIGMTNRCVPSGQGCIGHARQPMRCHVSRASPQAQVSCMHAVAGTRVRMGMRGTGLGGEGLACAW